MVSHLPTIMLVIGYVVYWLELYLFRPSDGYTSLLATVCFLVWAIYVLFTKRKELADNLFNWLQYIKSRSLTEKSFLFLTAALMGFILLVGLRASLYPIHLIQETDVLIYHVTIPRQHLILGNFSHIAWSTADLYLLPIQCALTPYWLIGQFPNKFPQFIFFIGLLVVTGRLTSFISSEKKYEAILWSVVVVVATHMLGIQLGTGMLEVVSAYLFIAFVDSLLRRKIWLASIEMTFYFWSKSFIPLQVVLIIVGMLVIWFVLVKVLKTTTVLGFEFGKKKEENFCLKDLRLGKMFLLFCILSVFIAGPFIVKNIKVAKTPLYPFGLGILLEKNSPERETVFWKSLEERTQQVLDTKDQYGSGRGPLEFLKHFWIIAVPEQSVNNRYDYPIGLTYLLFLGPFVVFFIISLKRKQFAILPWTVVLWWAIWWMGTQQSRFLFIPVILMMILVISLSEMRRGILAVGLIVALLLTGASVYRAHRYDLFRTSVDVLRPKDKILWEMSKTVDHTQATNLNFFDVAYADFPVNVVDSNSVFVLKSQ